MEKIQSGESFAAIMEKMNGIMEYSVPTGAIIPYAGNKAPEGWLICDGSSYNTTKYPALGALFGKSSGTFSVPDMRSKYIKGSSGGGVETGGGTVVISPRKGTKYEPPNQNLIGYPVFSSSGNLELPYVGLNFIIKY